MLAIIPGLLVATLVAFMSIFLSNYIPNVGTTTLSIFLGMLLGNTVLHKPSLQAGYKFAETSLLSLSIVFLGATLSAHALIELEFQGIAFIISQMSITITAALYIGKKLGFSDNFRFLMASGNAVCGSSAIAATAPVIDATEEEKGISITIVNVTGVVLMLLLPLLTNFLYAHELTKTSAMIGGTLQSVGQVVASGAMVSLAVKDLSTLFKIVRVILLVVVVLVLGNIKNKSLQVVDEESTTLELSNRKKMTIPWYVTGFFIACTLFTFNILPQSVSSFCKELSHYLEIIALAAIGLRVNFKELIKHGKAVSLYGLFVGCVQILTAIILISLFF